MESRRGVTGVAPAPEVAQGRCGRRGGGGSGGESDGSSSGVELSLRLKTGSSSPPAAVAEEEVEEAPAATAAPAPARRSMTIFYNGRVCAVYVTEIQAREIISMASQEILADQQQQVRRDDGRLQDSGSGSSSSSSSRAMARCDGQVRLTAQPAAAGDPRQGLAAVAAPVIDQAATGLSMKRSLQRFLQKRKARVATAVAPPYAGARQAQPLRR